MAPKRPRMGAKTAQEESFKIAPRGASLGNYAAAYVARKAIRWAQVWA